MFVLLTERSALVPHRLPVPLLLAPKALPVPLSGHSPNLTLSNAAPFCSSSSLRGKFFRILEFSDFYT